jgi:hypothetical protein
MTRSGFWLVIQRSFDKCAGDVNEQQRTLKDELELLTGEELVSFDLHFWELLRDSHTHDLWMAVYLIFRGYSDEGFEHFRSGLISRGHMWYERALSNADSLADYPSNLYEEIAAGGIAYIAPALYEKKFGEYPSPESGPYREIKNADWEEEQKDIKTRWPKLYEKYW